MSHDDPKTNQAADRGKRPIPPEMAEDVAAIQEAIDDMEAGDRGRPVAEVIAEMRAKLNAMRDKETTRPAEMISAELRERFGQRKRT